MPLAVDLIVRDLPVKDWHSAEILKKRNDKKLRKRAAVERNASWAAVFILSMSSAT